MMAYSIQGQIASEEGPAKRMRSIIKELMAHDGKRKVQIFRRAAESPGCIMANDRRVKCEWEHFEV